VGEYTNVWRGVKLNMSVEQIYIKKPKKHRKIDIELRGGGVVSQLGVSKPLGGCTNITDEEQSFVEVVIFLFIL